MKLQFLGGAETIGKSCYLLKLGEKSILIDCGIGVGCTKGNPLPNLDLIDHLDLVLITHAHLDHTGALPMLFRKFPNVKIICTLPTFSLMMLLLTDTLKLLEKDFTLYMKAGILFDTETLNQMAKNVFTCYFGKWFSPFPKKKVKIAFVKAGHILGASSVIIKSQEGTLFFSGDFCHYDQYTVKKAAQPDLSADVIVTETTYGNKIHPPRQKEELALLKAIEKIIEQKGKVLLPTFALGRGQELILITSLGQKKKIIPSCPIYVDGMVRDVCAIYEDQIKNGLFFRDQENVRRIETIEQRQEIVEDNEPCIIISSSGMLKGGPSVFYARELLACERHAIFFTCYQDEESPGGQLLECQGSTRIFIEDELLPKNCLITFYALSSHSDQKGLLKLMTRYEPKTVVLVHGEKDSRKQFALKLKEGKFQSKIFLPEDNSSLNL